MSPGKRTPQRSLHGFSIFLSASIPTPERRDEYERIPEAPLRIEEAVLCIARAVFMEGGTLVFGAHPSISPLVARVIDSYYVPGETSAKHSKNPSLVIYQSEVWRKDWAEATKILTRHPRVRVEWTKAQAGESVDLAIKNRPQAPKSMASMRTTMIKETRPIAMVAIGGMKGVLDEAEIFAKLRRRKPIFTLATTGGAAALLSKNPKYRDIVEVADAQAQNLVREFWSTQSKAGGGKSSRKGSTDFYVPYAFIAQQIIAKTLERANLRGAR